MPVSRWLAPAVLCAACAAACAAPAAEPAAATAAAPQQGEKNATAAALQQGEKKTSTDPAVNPHAAALLDFEIRVKAYADLQKRLAKGDAKQMETADPAMITAVKARLAAKLQAARRDAKQGDIFTPAVRPVFRRLLAPELKGEDGRDAKAVLKDDAPAPGTVPFKVNAKYPENQPRPTVPAKVLLSLPALPAPLEYRIVGQHLLLLDMEADLVVDYILNVITT
jgi:hypothetical protein